MDHIWRLSCPPPPQPKLGLASGRGRKQAMRVAGGEWNWAFFILASTYQLAMGCLPASSKDHGSCQATLSFRYSGSSLSFTSSDLRMISLTAVTRPRHCTVSGCFCFCIVFLLTDSIECHLFSDSISLIKLLPWPWVMQSDTLYCILKSKHKPNQTKNYCLSLNWFHNQLMGSDP